MMIRLVVRLLPLLFAAATAAALTVAVPAALAAGVIAVVAYRRPDRTRRGDSYDDGLTDELFTPGR
jgi:hypothetical protein